MSRALARACRTVKGAGPSFRSRGATAARRFASTPASDPAPLLRSLAELGGAYAPLARWLRPLLDSPGDDALVHPAVEARRVPGMGVGLVATAPVARGDVVLRLPPRAWRPLSASHATRVARERVPQFVSHAEDVARRLGAPDLTTHALLALHILFELGDESSPHRAYLASLPGLAGRESPSVPLLWTPPQIDTLRGTPTHAAVLARGEFVGAAHEALFPGGVGVPRRAFAWALSTVLSRAVSGPDAPYALLPAVDLLNHAGRDANCALAFDRDSDGDFEASNGTSNGGGMSNGDVDAFGFAEARCVADVGAGEQLTISYGDRADNDRTLRLYGFASQGNPNDRRALELRVEGDALEAWNQHRVWGPGMLLARGAILRRNGLPRLGAFDVDEDAAEKLRREVERAMGGGVAFRDPEARDPEASKEADDARDGDRDGDTRDVDFDADDDSDFFADDDASATSRSPVTWRCHVSHPSAAPYPARPSAPVDSSTPAAEAAVEAATAAARGEEGRSVSIDALLASLRAHLLVGTEPPGPDGHEPDPWAPVSEANEAAARAILADAARRAMEEMRLPSDAAETLDACEEDWAAAARTLREGQMDIVRALADVAERDKD